MFRAFHLVDIDKLKSVLNKYYIQGLKNYSSQENEINRALQKYIGKEKIVDGRKLQEAWFPEQKKDIFISHSHIDKEIAISLSGWFNSLGLTCFVDSCIWGNSVDLLKDINNKYAYNTQSDTYDYNIRNTTTSHVHAMLSSALLGTISSCECAIFINSSEAKEDINEDFHTVSPWIYLELSFMKHIKPTKPVRTFIKSELRENIKIKYDVDLSHLTTFDYYDYFFLEIEFLELSNSGRHKLDIIYEHFNK